MRVLIVEDEAITALELRRNLESWGYEVVETTVNGQRAIEIARELKPDLILMDIKLQGKTNGLDAARKIKRFLDVPFIFITAHNDLDYMEKAREFYVLYYIVKPFQTHELRYAVESSILHHRLFQRLRNSKNLYRSLLENLPGIIYRFDLREGETQFFNDMLEDITGYKVQDLNQSQSHPLEELVLPEDKAGIIKKLQSVRNSGQIYSLEYRILDKKGQIKNLRDEARPILNSESEVEAIEGIIFENKSS